MGFLSDLIAKGLSAIHRNTPIAHPVGDATDAIGHDTFDEFDWQDALEVPALRQMYDRLAVKHDYVWQFGEDFFNLLHKGDPQVRDEKEMDPRFKVNREMAQAFLDLPEMQSLRLSTRLDFYGAIMGSLACESRIVEAYEHAEEARQAEREAQEQREQMQQMLDDLSDLIQQAQGMDDDDPNAQELGAQIAAMIEALGGATTNVATAEANAQSAADQAARQAALMLRGAASEAAKQAQEEEQLCASYGVEP
jgi:hypothetical protein